MNNNKRRKKNYKNLKIVSNWSSRAYTAKRWIFVYWTTSRVENRIRHRARCVFYRVCKSREHVRFVTATGQKPNKSRRYTVRGVCVQGKKTNFRSYSTFYSSRRHVTRGIRGTRDDTNIWEEKTRFIAKKFATVSL